MPRAPLLRPCGSHAARAAQHPPAAAHRARAPSPRFGRLPRCTHLRVWCGSHHQRGGLDDVLVLGSSGHAISDVEQTRYHHASSELVLGRTPAERQGVRWPRRRGRRGDGRRRRARARPLRVDRGHQRFVLGASDAEPGLPRRRAAAGARRRPRVHERNGAAFNVRRARLRRARGRPAKVRAGAARLARRRRRSRRPRRGARPHRRRERHPLRARSSPSANFGPASSATLPPAPSLRW